MTGTKKQKLEKPELYENQNKMNAKNDYNQNN